MKILSVDIANDTVSQDTRYFVVRLSNTQGLTKNDIGALIIAQGQPIGFITNVVDEYVYGNIWTRYYHTWRRNRYWPYIDTSYNKGMHND